MRINTKQILLTLLIALVCGIIFYIVQLFYTSSVNNRSSRIYEQSLVASINQYEYLPSLIAEDETLRQVILDPAINHLEASQKLNFIAKRSGAEVVYLMDDNGTVKASSNHETKNGGFLYHNYSFRPYFSQALTEKTRQFYYAEGATTGIPGFFISSPILLDNEAIGVAVVKLDLSHWEQKWSKSTENIVVADKNNIIFLSSIDQWRYRSIGELPKNALEEINIQQQFPGKDHSILYSKLLDFNLSEDKNKNFWLVDKQLYLVNYFDIPQTQWRLYYLVNHDAILRSASIVFLITFILLFLAQLNIKNKRHILESKNKNRLLEIKRREEQQIVMDKIHIGVILFSKSGALLSTNEHAKHLLFENVNEVNSSSKANENTYISHLINIDNKDFDNILLQDIASPAYHETTTIARNQKPIPVMFAISKVNTMDKEVYLMTIVNITRRKIAENELINMNSELESLVENRTEELQVAQKKLIQKNKTLALGNMAATIVHELSQPLTAMKSSIAAIDAKIKNNDWVGASESTARLAPLSNKMHNVIKLLKFFSYQDKDSYTTINLVDTVNKTLNTFKDVLTEKNIRSTINNDINELLISANPLKIDLVLSNIIQNAIDALEEIPNPCLTITIHSDNGWVILTIQDNAAGVDHEVKEKMFSPYFTTKEVGKGLGLGLAITYEIIQEYGGSIRVENILDDISKQKESRLTNAKLKQRGAQFIISLPLKQTFDLASSH
jgi:two-component system C4-dicarboxylate transport sensor histidine kinase DctB